MPVDRVSEIVKRLRVPLVGMSTSRPATAGAFVTKDQRFINYLVTVLDNPTTGKKNPVCLKRPGFEAYLTPAAGSIGTALHVWEGVGSGTTLVSAFGPTNSTIYENTSSLGAITGKARDITETDATGTATLVIPSTDSTCWYYPTGGSLTKITDADFPGNAGFTTCGSVVHMNGYVFIMATDGSIWNSDNASVTAWTATNFIEPTLYPFEGVGLARHRDTIVAIGKAGTAFYEDVGGTTTPLAERGILSTRWGGVRPAGNGSTITQVRDNVYYISVSNLGGAAVCAIDNFRVTPISTPVIDAQIEVFEPQNCTLTATRIWGVDYLILHAGQTFVYNIKDQVWFEWAAGSAGVLWHVCTGAAHGDARQFALSSVATGGKIYEINTDTPVYQDDGSAYTATIQTALIDFDTENRKRFIEIHLIGDKQASTTTVGISWSDDDYGTFSTERNVDMANNRAYLKQLGSGRRRAFKFTNATNTPVRLEAFELVYSVGEH